MATINGTESGESLFGTGYGDSINGYGGSDTLDGGDGNDTILGGNGADTIDGGLANDSLDGGEGSDSILGGEGSDTLFGGTENDTLDGGNGDDSMDGGYGDDTYYVNSTTDVVTEVSGAGFDTVHASMTFTLGANVENLVVDGYGQNGFGNDLNNSINAYGGANRLEGAGGDDTLNGGPDEDTLVGGTGDDVYYVEFAGTGGDLVVEAAGQGNDVVFAQYGGRLSANVERLGIVQGDGIGNGLANEIFGTDGGYAHRLVGLGGDDSLTGNDLDDRLLGGGGNDSLDGSTGYDTMIGGAGSDTYEVDSQWDRVVERAGQGTDTVRSTVDFSLDANLENLKLLGESDLFGDGNDLANSIIGNYGDNLLTAGGGNDTVQGSYGNDLIDGGTGNDTIDGGFGADVMIGGEGNDTYYVDNSDDMTLEDADEGTDTVVSTVTWTLDDNTENLQLGGGELGINGYGNALDNVITGNAGNNLLDGKGGADSMTGGAGDDTYVVNNAGDFVTETGGQGRDAVRSSITYTLTPFVEDLVLTGNNGTTGTGNGLGNFIAGNSGANLLDGAGGADTLVGGAGHDNLVGGTAADSFRYAGPLAGAHSDTISDFVHLTDHIDLAAGTFAAIEIGNLQASQFRTGTNYSGSTGAVDANDRILYDSDSGNLYYDSNGSEAGGRTLIFTLATHPADLSAADIRIFADG